MAIDKDKVQIANLALQYLSNIQSITNGTARTEALKLISKTTVGTNAQMNFGDLFISVFDEIETLCSDEQNT